MKTGNAAEFCADFTEPIEPEAYLRDRIAAQLARWSFCWGFTYPLWVSRVWYDGDHYTLHLGVCSVGYSP